jgi:arylsulfatase A-like enzyme
LEAKGYRTGAFSANYVFFTSSVGLGKGFIHFEDYFQSPRDMFMRSSFGRNGLPQICSRMLGLADWMQSYKPASEVSREALRWIEEDEHPFFAFVNYFGVHEANTRLWKRVRPVWGKTNEIDRYDSALTYTDAEIGKLFQQLELRGITNNTLLIITSDHGQGLGQHQLFAHASALYLEQIHVPLIVWYPGHVPAGIRISTPVSDTAIAATVMDVITGKSQPFIGSGLASLWTPDSVIVDHPHPISELAKNDLDDRDKSARRLVPTAFDGHMKSILTPHWHLIEHQTLGNQLYDWVNDPGELKNLIDTPEGAVVAHSLEVEIQGDKSP